MHASERHSARLTSVREWTWSSIATLPSLSPFPYPTLHPCCPENFYSRCLSLMHVKRGTHKRSFIVPQRAPARATRLRQVLVSGTRSRAGCRALVAVVAASPPTPPHLSSHSTSVYSHFPTLGCPHPRSWNITRRTSTSHLSER